MPDPMDLSKDQGVYPISSTIISGVSIFMDSMAVLVSGFAACFLLIGASSANIELYASAILFIWIAIFMFFHFAGLYQFDPIMSPMGYWEKFVVAYITSFLMLLAIAFSFKVSHTFSRLWVYSFAIGAGASIVLLRLCLWGVVNKLSSKGFFVRNVVIVGGGDQGRRLLNYINEVKPRFVKILGVFDDRMELAGAEVAGYGVKGNLKDLVRFARRKRVDDVIIALPWSAEDNLRSIVERLRELPINIYLGSDLIGFHMEFRPPPSHFNELPMVEVAGKPMAGWSVVYKFLEDIILASLIIIVCLPMMALIAVAIKLDSPGPVLFKQRRLGFNNKIFNVYKFRSMRNNCSPVDGATIQATRNDLRVTRVGKFLRRTSLDELPQLFNVLNGTMSLVGPRPHAIDHNEEYSKKIYGYFARHRVKPGITGWAQVNGLRGEIDVLEKMEERVRHDIYYAENWSLGFDLKILAKTALVVLSGDNAY